VDSAIYEAVLNMMESLVTEFDKSGYIRERSGAILPNVAPSNVYPTADSLVLIAANQDAVFQRLCAAMGQRELALHPDYATHQMRGQNQRVLDELIGQWTAGLSTAKVLDLMDKHGVPAGLIYRAPDMMTDPQFVARESIVSITHPQLGELKMQNVAPKLSETPGRIRSTSPGLGEHNEEIYRDLLEVSPARFEQLRTNGVI
jgi:formyl-CoA transferase